MKTKIFTLMIFFCALQLSAQRQMDPKMIEMIKSKKVAFITEQIGLTSKEGEKFWPVYNQLERERMVLNDKKRDLEESAEDKTAKTEEAYRKLADELKVKAAELIHPTRVSISGRTIGAGLFDMMELLGRDKVIARLSKFI